jgi:hypothetical protein
MTTGIPATANPAPFLRLASVTSICCLLLAIALPALSIYFDLTQPEPLINSIRLPKPVNPADFTLFQRFAVAALGTLSPLFQAYGFLSARRCFQSFARREYFTPQVVKGLRGFAAGLFFAIVTSILVVPLLSMVVTLNAGPGGHTISVGIESDQVIRLLFAAILWQIAGVMMNGVRLAEENSQFI